MPVADVTHVEPLRADLSLSPEEKDEMNGRLLRISHMQIIDLKAVIVVIEISNISVCSIETQR
jgi:hypothetical protein